MKKINVKCLSISSILAAFTMVSILPLASENLARATTPAKQNEISMEAAKKIATQRVKGEITSSEYEFEKGQNVYSFDIVSKDGKIHEILVSASSGKIISTTIESKAKEAAEKKTDEEKE